MHPVEAYFRDLRDIRSSGAAVPETSYHGTMARRIGTILLLGPALNANYQAVKQAGSGWPVEAGEA